MYSGKNPKYIGRVWVRQRVAGEIIRGFQRRGIKSRNLREEAVYTNLRTSPRVEVPRVVIDTMRVETKTVLANDIALFWRLFAEARFHGMQRSMHSIRLSELRHYLGYRSSARIYQCLERLTNTEMSCDYGRGRVAVPMIELVEVDHDDVLWMTEEPGFRKGDTLIHFRLPESLREAVLQSREYAWVDLNALSRFECKYTTSLYMRLCLVAGRSRSEWRNLSMSKADIKQVLGMPSSIRDGVFQDTMRLIENDLLSIDGPRKRFDVSMLWPTSSAEKDTFEFDTTGSARKLREVAPVELSDADYERVSDYSFTKLERAEMPGVLRLRQSTALARETRGGIHVLAVRDMWARAVNEAKEGNGVVGMPAEEFLGLVGEDVEYALELWTERMDFGVEVTFAPVSAETPAEPRKLSLHDIPGAMFQCASYSPPIGDEDDDDDESQTDDLRTADDFVELCEVRYDGEEPPDFGAFDDDYDIAA